MSKKSIVIQHEYSLPPSTTHALSDGIPHDDFIVTRNVDGAPASRYGDLTWDIRAYAPTARFCHLHLNPWKVVEDFTPNQLALIAEVRWITFLDMFHRESSLAITSINQQVKLVREVARFAGKHGATLKQVIGSVELLTKYLSTASSGSAKCLSSTLKHLYKLGPDVTGMEVPLSKIEGTLKSKAEEGRDRRRQHAPLPSRIYSLFLSHLAQEIAELSKVADGLAAAVKYCLSSPLAGRGIKTQYTLRKQLGISSELFLDFKGVLQKYGLSEFFQKRGYGNGANSLERAIGDLYAITQLQIEAFTGMRSNEAATLPYDCIEEEKWDGKTYFLIAGVTTKLNKGKPFRTRWVTSDAGREAARLAQKISNAIYQSYGHKLTKKNARTSQCMLFVQAGIGANLFDPIRPYRLNLHEKPELLERVLPTVTEEDIKELEAIDPHRAWRAEFEFQVGARWHLKQHQLRRSLALYAQRSGLVSLPSLKRQLQHITAAMSRYYSRGSIFAKNLIGDDQEHFGNIWLATQAESQCVAYWKLITGEEPIHGGHGNWVNFQRNRDGSIFQVSREEIQKRFDKGLMTYKETPVGGCTNPGPCNSPVMDLYDIKCMEKGCKFQVLRLSDIDQVIAMQKQSVEVARERYPDSATLRTEEHNMNVLESAREKFTKQARERMTT